MLTTSRQREVKFVNTTWHCSGLHPRCYLLARNTASCKCMLLLYQLCGESLNLQPHLAPACNIQIQHQCPPRMHLNVVGRDIQNVFQTCHRLRSRATLLVSDSIQPNECVKKPCTPAPDPRIITHAHMSVSIDSVHSVPHDTSSTVTTVLIFPTLFQDLPHLITRQHGHPHLVVRSQPMGTEFAGSTRVQFAQPRQGPR